MASVAKLKGEKGRFVVTWSIQDFAGVANARSISEVRWLK